MVGEWGGVKSSGSVAGQVFNLIQLECFYNNDHVLSSPIDSGVSATVDDNCDDASLHAVC